MWGIIPAAGAGRRVQPLAFSKELLPVGSRLDGGVERPRAVTEYLVERMLIAGVEKFCFVISPGRSDILDYFGGDCGGASENCLGTRATPAHICYIVQPRPAGLCDAIFRALSLIAPEEQVLVGLPDTFWLPEDGFCALPNDQLTFLLFPVEFPDHFDAVVTDERGRVQFERRWRIIWAFLSTCFNGLKLRPPRSAWLNSRERFR